MKKFYLILFITNNYFISCLTMGNPAFPKNLTAEKAIQLNSVNTEYMRSQAILGFNSFIINIYADTDNLKFQFLSGQISEQQLKQLYPGISESDYGALLAIKTQIGQNTLNASELGLIHKWQEELREKHTTLFEQMKKKKEDMPALIRSGTVIINHETYTESN